MGKLPKRKRLQNLNKRSHEDVDADQEEFHKKNPLYENDDDDDDVDDDDHQEDDQYLDQDAAGGNNNFTSVKIGRSVEANMRDMEYLEKARIEREKRKDPKFQQQQRLLQALQRKRELDTKHEQEMLAQKRVEEEQMNGSSFAAVNPRATLDAITSGRPVGNAGPASSVLTSNAMFSHPLLELDECLIDALHRCSFTHLMLIQERVLPFAIQGYDILGQARTGSGKTLAFCIPALQGIISSLKKGDSSVSKTCYGLMLAPTKELAHQINSVLTKIAEQLANKSNLNNKTGKNSSSVITISSELVTGGTKVQEERNRLLRANIVVGTPGRIADHLKSTPQWNLHMLKFFVLDEVDRMLHEGFAVAVDAIIAALPSTRQTLLFSATSGKAVGSLARLALSKTPMLISEKLDQPQYLREEDQEILGEVEYISLKMNNGGDGENANEQSNEEREQNASHVPQSLEQYAQIVPTHDRLRALYIFVKKVAKTQKAIVFCSTVASATFHCMMMGAVGFHNEVLMLHGKMKHRQRLQVFEAFQEWPNGVLFCTDVAARGLDIPQVSFVLQLDPPVDPTEYVHRAGRTARAGAAGKSLIFLRPEERGFLEYARRFGLAIQVMAPSKLPDIQHRLEYILEADPLVAKAALSAYQATIGAYESHVLKTIFDPNSLLLVDLAIAFGLAQVPLKGIRKLDVDEEFEDDAFGGGADMVDTMTVASRNKIKGGGGSGSGSGAGGDQSEYVKGKFKSLHRRRMQQVARFHRDKTKKQWTDDGKFVGIKKPSSRL